MGILREVARQTATVVLDKDGKTAEVRGLSLVDIGLLTGKHLKELSQVFEGQISVEELATRWPEFSSKLIAIAMDEPDDWEFAQKLPLGAQIGALMQIWDLTVIDPAVLGKAYARVTAALQLMFNQQVALASAESKKETGKMTSSKLPKPSPHQGTGGEKS